MPGRVYELAFKIGGKLSQTFTGAFTNAGNTLGALNKRVIEIEKSRGRADRFRKLSAEIHNTNHDLIQAQKEVRSLAREISRTDKPSKQLQADFAKAQKKASSLENALSKQRTEFKDLSAEMSKAGVHTHNLAAHQARLARNAEQARKAQEGLNRVMVKHAAVKRTRAEKRGQMMDAVALAATVAAPVITAAQAEQAEIRLSTVINAEDKGKALADARKKARELAMAGILGYREAFDTQYAGNSAELSATTARLASETIGKVATITAGVPERVGEVIATTYNNLGKNMEGTAEQKINRIGELLTKVQFKFQIRDFSQLGESMKEGASALAGHNVQLSQGVTLLGKLNSAGLQGTQAGTMFSSVLAQLTKAQERWGTEIVRNEKGEMDMIATLKNLDEYLSGEFGEDTDARIAEVIKVFGVEGKKALIPLLEQVDKLGEAHKDVSENSKGLVNKEYIKFSKSAIGQMKKLTGTTTVLADAFGRTLLPGVNAGMGGLARLAGVAVDFTDKYPRLTGVVATGLAGLIGLKVASIAAGYGFTFLHGGVLQAAKIFRIMWGLVTLNKATLMQYTIVQKAATAWTWATAAAQKAWNVTLAAPAFVLAKARVMGLVMAQKAALVGTKLWTAGQWLLNIALNANPIGIIVGGAIALAGAGSLVYRHWDTVKELFFKFHPAGIIAKNWDKVKEYFYRFHPLGIIISNFRPVMDWFRNLNLFEAGANLIKTLVTGIKSKALEAVNAVKGIFGKIGRFLPGSDAKEGPLSRLTASGRAIVTTMGQGIKQAGSQPLTQPMSRAMAPVTLSGGSAGPPAQGIHIVYSPTIHLDANGPAPQVKAAADQSLMESERRFRDMMESFFEGEQRLSYA